jgi:KTSC domain
MSWTPVESSVLQAAAYAESQAVLYLLFRSGEVYRYFGVPRWQYQEFLAADSKGQYFGRNIRGQFRYEWMRRPR